MAAPNLTRDQAQDRAELLEVESYRIELDLTDGGGKPGSDTFRSTTTVVFRSRTPGASSWIDIVAATVHRAVLNGSELDVSGYREEDGVVLPDLAETNELTIEADCRYMNTGEGLHRFVDPVDGGVYLYSQFETADAKRMFACFDQPDLKAVYSMRSTAPHDWKVISNGEITATEDGEGGADVHTFATTKPMSTYLVALVAGPYAEWRDEFVEGDFKIPLGIYCRASLAPHMDHERLFTETKQGFGFFAQGVRGAVPVRQVRPVLRAGVQRRRDGERRLRHASSRTTSSAAVSPATSTSGVPRPCCTRWRTCGSATW